VLLVYRKTADSRSVMRLTKNDIIVDKEPPCRKTGFMKVASFSGISSKKQYRKSIMNRSATTTTYTDMATYTHAFFK
jgi:hypothetical protein